MPVILLTLTALLAFAPGAAAATPPLPYDEGAHERYRPLASVLEALTPAELRAFEERASAIGSQNRRLLPLPRLVSRAEHELLLAGTRQRGAALWEFYKDLATGRLRAVEAGVIPREVVRLLLAKSRLDGVQGFPIERVAFAYGPDIVRGPDGRFYVLEDNLGDLGGMADATQSRHDLLQLLPEYQRTLSASAGKSYAQVVAEALRRAAVHPDGELVALIPSDLMESNRYLVEQLRGQGVRVFDSRDFPVSARAGEAFLDRAALERTRVGALLLRGVEWAPFERNYPELAAAFRNGRLPIFGSPFMDVAGDKELLQYTDDLVRFYLGQEPLLRSAPTRSFRIAGSDGKEALDSGLLTRIFQDLRRYVIKKTEGAHGDGVWLGNRLAPDPARKLRAAIALRPGSYVAQSLIPLSVLRDYLVDARVLAVITEHGVTTGEHLFGRAVHVSGDGRVNMGQRGVGLAHFVEGVDTLAGAACLARTRRGLE